MATISALLLANRSFAARCLSGTALTQVAERM